MVEKTSTNSEVVNSASAVGGSASGTPAPDMQAIGSGAQSGNLAPSPASQAVEDRPLYPLKLSVDNHTHGGVDYKRGATIALDAAEYTWAIRNQLGTPGRADDVGLDVNSQGQVIRPEVPKPVELPQAIK